MKILSILLFAAFASTAHAATCRIECGDATVGDTLHVRVVCDDVNADTVSNGMDVTVSWDDSKWTLATLATSPSAPAPAFSRDSPYGFWNNSGPPTDSPQLVPCWGYFEFPSPTFKTAVAGGRKYLWNTIIRYVRTQPCDVLWTLSPPGQQFQMMEFWLTPKPGTQLQTTTIRLEPYTYPCVGTPTNCSSSCPGGCVPWTGTVHYASGTTIRPTLFNADVFIDVSEQGP